MNDKDQKQRIQELLLLQRVAQRINSILDLDILLEEVVSDVAQTFGYSRSGILLKDDETNELEIAAVRGWTVNYHMKGERFKIGEFGMVGHVGETGETYYAPDVISDPFYQISEESTRSELDIPLKIHGRLIGVFNFQHQEINAFSDSRIQLLEALAGHVATAIENARLFENERKEKDRMLSELNEAQSVQRALFPDWTPDIPGFEITGLCIPCREVGGDWFDYIPLQDGRLALVLADVSGKGTGAALLMTSTRSVLKMFAERGLSPGKVLSQVNRLLLKDFPKPKFVTMVYAIIDPARKSVVFANAGHLPPLFADSKGQQFLNVDFGLPLGIQEGTYTEQTVDMQTGNRLLLYSDGISEAMNSSSEEYGEQRIREHMTNPTASSKSLLDSVHTFLGGSPVSDDMTVVLIKSED
jgi:sigma-B regulation protein RsbU (phosphoserine phosphatase)